MIRQVFHLEDGIEFRLRACEERAGSHGLMVEPGQSKQISVALVRDMIYNWSEIPKNVHALLTGSDVYAEWQDMLPALYQFLSYSHVLSYRTQVKDRQHKRSDIVAAQFFDISWDGQPIP